LGVALKEIDLPREEFFITTKVLSSIKDPEKALKTSLKKLQIDYVDLYLIHGPFKVDLEKAWPELEALKEQGTTLQFG
jgi:diketogulonate reductase-like aldo/keto reductase